MDHNKNKRNNEDTDKIQGAEQEPAYEVSIRWTEKEYQDYNLRRAKAGDKRVCATEPECPEKLSLDRPGKGKSQGGLRFKILFTVYARRPGDWDNARLKELQDCIVKAGILDDDKWDILEGAVVSRKTHTEAEEKTVVEIELCTIQT